MSMQFYIGTKFVKATPMTRGAYNAYRDWILPMGENAADPGYLVEYCDGGASNHPDHDNYISWSPADVFEGAYRRTDGLSFGLALDALKQGLRLARAGWNGKNQFIYQITAAQLQDGLKYGFGESLSEPTITPSLAIKTTNNQIQIGWVPTQSDMHAEDWSIVE